VLSKDIPIHGNNFMLFVIHDKGLAMVGATLFNIFLLDTMANNTSHALRFCNINRGRRIIELKNLHIFVVLCQETKTFNSLVVDGGVVVGMPLL
jgi:hypothetical protein